MPGKPKTPTPPADYRLLGLFALIKIVLHLAVLGRYGIFRDEFYYLACARNLDWGYVDHPPLSLAILAAWTALFGDGMLALRLPAIIVGAATVFLTGLLARELGGGRFAQALACLSVLIAPLFLAIANFYSMNVFDQLCWVVLACILARYCNTADPRWWIPFGIVAGLGLQNKISVLFLGFGVVVALLLTHHRAVFRKKELWLGGALALLIFLPHLIWQAAHGAPTLEFMHNATTLKNTATSPIQFFLGLVVEMHPLNALLWLAGLGFALVHPIGKRYRLLGLAFIAVFLVFSLNNGKVYYLAPAMPIALALGAVAWEHWLGQRTAWRAALITPLAVFGIALLPMSLPVLSPEGLVRFQQTIGLAPTQMERGANSAFPQHFADRFGWEELAAFVAENYAPLASTPNAPTVIMVSNYGEAGALEYYSDTYTLPRVACGHNNYHLWGPGDFSGDTFLAYGIDRDRLETYCESVEEIARFKHPHVMPYQNDQPLFLCTGLKQPIDQLWPELKFYI